MTRHEDFSDFVDLLEADSEADDAAIPEFGIRIVVCLDEDGSQSVRWKKHGEGSVQHHVAALEQVKFLLLLNDVAEHPDIHIPEESDGD